MHGPLEKSLRTQLETTVNAARACAEAGAREALEMLGVADANAPEHLSAAERNLRVRLRAHARQLGEALSKDGRQEVSSLIEEIAYEHWHRMLFARFLAENNLLLYEGVPITLADCRDLAEELHFASLWELAASCAAKMLPQIFRLDSPSFELSFSPNRIQALERFLNSIAPATFAASDALGWLYQFWQTQKKKGINESKVKIGAKELPAVTQLFTEPYMVSFLLDNSLGAWYAAPKLAGRVFDSEAEAKAAVATPAIPLQYLRLVQQEDHTWLPAGGTFDKWPTELKDFTLLDPCCGAGHFLVASFLMLVPMRMEREGLDAATAVKKVLTENIHGLELDQRCVELAAFALALEAWRYPEAGGYRALPSLHLACDGIAPRMKKEEWLHLVREAAKKLPERPNDDPEARESKLLTAMGKLYDTFGNAPVLGSLINPERLAGDLLQADLAEVAKILHDTLANNNDETQEAAVAAHGIIKALELLDQKYTLVITNPPYLGRGKQTPLLQDFCEKYYNDAKGELATVFLNRCLENNCESGTSCLVLPQNWMFLKTYCKFRTRLLTDNSLNIISQLGEHGFDSAAAAGAFVVLLILSKCRCKENEISCMDISAAKNPVEKSEMILANPLLKISQFDQTQKPDARITLNHTEQFELLQQYADSLVGLQTGDDPRFIVCFWELPAVEHNVWEYLQKTPDEFRFVTGLTSLVRWEKGQGTLLSLDAARPMQGLKAVGHAGIAVHRMRRIFPYFYAKTRFHQNAAVLLPQKADYLLPIYAYVQSEAYTTDVRNIDQKLNVTNATLVKVPFDLEYWTKVAEEKYPHGLPEPFTDDPTQWIFHGHPCASVVWDEETKQLKIGENRIDSTVLQVAVARLLGYRWPAELDPEMELAPEMRKVMKRLDELKDFTDKDGIVCIPALRQEQDAGTRLLSLLAAAYGDSWEGTIPDRLLAACGCEGMSLEPWLRDRFFVQHAKLFGDRPFIWQIWDGLRDGFSVLVNYHKLDSRLLNTLIYSYLGDWINKQKNGIAAGVDGTQEKLDAAETLKSKLIAIQEGEAPYDIFVRWKPLSEQPVGWNPDLNDGVRLNIRPFMMTGVLRENNPPRLNIKWAEDRGKDAASAPWYPVFHGDRINDHHLTLAEKKK